MSIHRYTGVFAYSRLEIEMEFKLGEWYARIIVTEPGGKKHAATVGLSTNAQNKALLARHQAKNELCKLIKRWLGLQGRDLKVDGAWTPVIDK